MSTKNKRPTNKQIDLDFLKIQYQVLSERRVNHNTLLWNVPSLLFVAQTLLWTISLNSDNNSLIRCVISFLSIIVVSLSIQIFKRIRLLEIVDAEQMYAIEKYIQNLNHGKYEAPIMIIHHQLNKRTLIGQKYDTVTDLINNHPNYKKYNFKKLISKTPSNNLWEIIFILMLIFSSAIFIYNLVLCYR